MFVLVELRGREEWVPRGGLVTKGGTRSKLGCPYLHEGWKSLEEENEVVKVDLKG